MKSWQEGRVETVAVDGMVVRLCKPWLLNADNPELSGCETTYQVGLWTSESCRPKGQFRFGAHADSMPMGRISYVPAGVKWNATIESQQDARAALFCDFDPGRFRNVTRLDPDEGSRHLAACHTVTTPRMQQALWALLEEVNMPGFGHHMSVEALGQLIMVEVARYFRGVESMEERRCKGLSDVQVARIRGFIEESSGQRITIRAIADLCGISSSHMRRVFKETTGLSLGAYVEQVRIARAKALLGENRLPLKQIAFQLGFANPSAFSAAFRRATGSTPRNYRLALAA